LKARPDKLTVHEKQIKYTHTYIDTHHFNCHHDYHSLFVPGLGGTGIREVTQTE